MLQRQPIKCLILYLLSHFHSPLPKGYTLGKQSFVKLKYQFLSISIEDCAFFFFCSLKEEANVPSKLENNWTQIIKNSYLTKF